MTMTKARKVSDRVPIRKLEPGKRLRAMRELIGLTQGDFAEIVGIPRYRLTKLENLITQISIKDIEAVTDVFPDFLSWLAVEGDITLADLKESQSKLCKAIAARIEAGLIPEGYFLEEKIK